MHHRDLLTLALLAVSPLALTPVIGCGGDDKAGGSSSSSTTTTTSGTGGSGGGAGGSGGSAGGSGGGGAVDPGEPADHLLISEVGVAPGAGEFIEIWNPTKSEVDLTNYFLSDNSAYYGIADGKPWMPIGSEGTDFLAQFPAGSKIGPDAVIVLATDAGFEPQFMKCADYALVTAPIPCGGKSVTPMLAPQNGGLGAQSGGLLTNDGEMLVLFTWDGTVGHTVKDVDYVIWGADPGQSERADKTGHMGYAADTARSGQHAAAAPAANQSLQRCDAREAGETLKGGNGITGHDETSERLDKSLVVGMKPSPGVKNTCP